MPFAASNPGSILSCLVLIDPLLAFADLDVMAIGPVVKEVSSAFDLYWNSELSYPATSLRGKTASTEEVEALRGQLDAYVAQQKDPAYLKALNESNLDEKFRSKQVSYDWGAGDVVYDRPEKILQDAEKKDSHLSTQMAPYFEGVKDELIISSPYFVPGKAGTRFLVGLAERGVQVRILTNSLASNVAYRIAVVRFGEKMQACQASPWPRVDPHNTFSCAYLEI